MTIYQRGNRDGLLNAAAEIDTQADQASTEGATWERSAENCRNPVAHLSLAVNCHRQANTLRNVVARLRTLAEALPEDPEASETP